MNNWPSHVTKTRHLASRQNRPRLTESYKRASDWPNRTHIGHFLRLRQAGPPIQSQFSLHSECVIVFGYGLVFSTGWVARTSHIDPTSLNLHDVRVFCFHVGICVKARPQPWIILSGVGGKFVTMNTRPKIPKMSISTALWTRSLMNAIISVKGFCPLATRTFSKFLLNT